MKRPIRSLLMHGRQALAAGAVFAALAGCGGRDAARATAAAAAATAPRDTATLGAEAVRLGGFAVDSAAVAPWRDGWTAPAKLILDPNATEAMGAIVEGRVTRVYVRVGDTVRAGQVLVAVHSHEMMDARSALAKAEAASVDAEAALRVARSAAARAERLYAITALSLADLEQARAKLAQATAVRAQSAAELARARAMRDHLLGGGPVPRGIDEHDALVRSPIDGTITALDARPGSVVLVGAPLVTVGHPGALLLTLDLPESALAVARRGSTVRFTVAPFPGDHFDAEVIRVAPTLDSVTRTIAVQARVLDGGARLRAEMYATAELLGPPGDPVLTVPSGAVQALDADTVVIAVRPLERGMRIEAIPVRIGRRTSERAEVRAGLAPGARILTEGSAVAKAELLRRRGGA